MQCNEVGAPLTVWAFQGKQDMFTASLCVPLLEVLQGLSEELFRTQYKQRFNSSFPCLFKTRQQI